MSSKRKQLKRRETPTISDNIINKENKQKKSFSTPKWFYSVLFLTPFLLIILLEISLRIFNYGENNDQWIDAGNNQIKLNYYIARRYFSDEKLAPVVLSQAFDKEKKENSFRVFVLGESSAAGFPFLPNGSFSNYIDQRLKLVYPESIIEVINLGITASTSYAWLDILPGIIEQKPDLLIIYGGHNEYYGALGVASTESISNSKPIIKFYLWLNKFKTTELISNFVKWVSDLFSSGAQTRKESGTLMTKLSKGNYIQHGSERFKRGIEQFESNMEEIISLCKENEIPVILSTLTSNLKDQPPFISEASAILPAADEIYKRAKERLSNNKLKEADSLFRYAKDLDALRFRAPEEINKIILRLGEKFNGYVTNIDSLFRSISPGNIVGDNLMTDHLHPSLFGYQVMGRLFFEVMKRNNLLPKSFPVLMSDSVQDSVVRNNFLFSPIDSVIAAERIRVLKNDWPFIQDGNVSLNNDHTMKNYFDSLAYLVSTNKLGWGQAHYVCAYRYEKANDLKPLIREYEILVDNFPSDEQSADKLISLLVKTKRFDRAYPYLKRFYIRNPKPEYGIPLAKLFLEKDQPQQAMQYLNQSRTSSPYNAEVYFLLASAYYKNGELINARDAIYRCMELEQNFTGAKELYSQISGSIK